MHQHLNSSTKTEEKIVQTWHVGILVFGFDLKKTIEAMIGDYTKVEPEIHVIERKV